jgi:hypothetical protein
VIAPTDGGEFLFPTKLQGDGEQYFSFYSLTHHLLGWMSQDLKFAPVLQVEQDAHSLLSLERNA